MFSFSLHFLLALVAVATLTAGLPLGGPGYSLNRPEPVTYAFRGDFTHYTVGLGACGKTHKDLDMVVAISALHFDVDRPCGRRVKISGLAGSAVAEVVDRCEGCQLNDLDLSPQAFKAVIGDTDIGRAEGTWQWE